MIRDDIIRMAREAGFAVNEKARQHQPNCIFHTQYMVDELLERFAALVRADERDRSTRENAYVQAEREACARVVMSMRGKCWAYDHDVIAEAILARGKS